MSKQMSDFNAKQLLYVCVYDANGLGVSSMIVSFNRNSNFAATEKWIFHTAIFFRVVFLLREV